MNPEPLSRDDALRPEMADRLDQVCDRFEAACLANERPRIEDYLINEPDPEWVLLLSRLLRLELAYRTGRGELPTLNEYVERFPEHTVLITSVIGEANHPVSHISSLAGTNPA